MTAQLDKFKPLLILLAVLIVSAILGYAWGASAVDIKSTGLWQLGPSYQGIYVQAVADAYALDASDALAAERLSFLCQQDGGLDSALAEAERLYGADPGRRANLDQLRTLAGSGQVVQNPSTSVCNYKPIGGLISAARIAAPILLILGVLGIVGYGVLTMRRGEEASFAAPAARPAPAAAPPAPPGEQVTVPARPGRPQPPLVEGDTPAPQQPETTARSSRVSLPSFPSFGKKKEEEEEKVSAAAVGAQISRQAEKTDFEALGQDPPLVQFMTTYLHGDDLYDDSFSIETASGEFLGETGVGISETLGSSADAKNVTALEVWLFDKNDIRTVTKVLMSDHAFNDDAIRAKLAPKGEAVLARDGDKILLETATLRIQARIVDLSYRSDLMPPNGIIDRITIELAAWKRDGQTPRAGSGLPSFSRVDD